MKNHFGLIDQDVREDPFHYMGCGLDDVYLVNGFTRHETEYGAGYSIEDIESLHAAIGRHIILQKGTMSNKEFKFLRKEMGMTQEELSRLIGVSPQQIARYEKAKTDIQEPADRLIRMMYALHLIPAENRQEVMQEILEKIRDESDECPDMPARFYRERNDWLEQAA